jgi:hypothetical protein
VLRVLEVLAVVVVLGGLLDAILEPTVPAWLQLTVLFLLAVALILLFVRVARIVRLMGRAVRGDATAAWTDYQFPQGSPLALVVPLTTPAGWQVSLRAGEQWYWDGTRYIGDRPNVVGWHLNAREGQLWYWDGQRYGHKKPLDVGWHPFDDAGVEALWDGSEWTQRREIANWSAPEGPGPTWSSS